VNPMTGNTDTISQFLADPVEMKLLHMDHGRPARTPNLVMFADPDYFLFRRGDELHFTCVTENPSFAWNHGDVQSDIATTWLGLGRSRREAVRHRQRDLSDHTDIPSHHPRVARLKDDYVHDGRVLVENMRDDALPSGVRRNPVRLPCWPRPISRSMLRWGNSGW